jgi:hypothetical protein
VFDVGCWLLDVLVPSPLPGRAFPTAQSVSKISPTSAALARANRLAISGAVTGSITVASAVLTALTRSDSVFGQACFPARFFQGFASGSTSTARAICCVWAQPGFW